MDFDEYEYLEKTVEASAAPPANGSDGKDRGSRRPGSPGDAGGRAKERLGRESEREREKDRERRSRDRDREERERERRSRSRSERRRGDDERERERFRERDYRDRDVRFNVLVQSSVGLDIEPDLGYKVRDVRLIMDRNSRRSKGVGYIEFYDAMSVPMAIALRGQPLLGQPVDVKPSEAEKNLVQSNASSSVAASGGARKLYVGNLHSNITEEQLRLFARLEDAKAAQSLNGQLDIAGKVIKVSAVTEQPGVQASGATAGDLDDDEGGGLALNASSRALLMQKLDRSGATTSLTSGLGASAVALPPVSVLGAPATGPVLQSTVPGLGLIPGASIPVITQSIDTAPPSECLLLKNMFDPAVETDPDFDLDIRDDVREECSKFGQVRHIFVDKNTAGFVYLRFDSITAAMGAQKALQGRWFAGKMITATFMSTQQYEMKFPE
ncbi:RNA-binding protein 39 [Triticum urartu]|uniref:RNA-binding protein 39 n=1 Tax=Triticum urartu TaxID=4572 RepID=M7Z129_TRIUA|nr:RNA-binding protein 39 [Triticum urartu]